MSRHEVELDLRAFVVPCAESHRIVAMGSGNSTGAVVVGKPWPRDRHRDARAHVIVLNAF